MPVSIVVQKFGGSSLANTRLVVRCARRAVMTREQGHQVVVVVSAMGRDTDALLRMADDVAGRSAHRERDLLMAAGEQVSCALMTMAIRQLGVEAVALCGTELGVLTGADHGRARVRSIDAVQLRRHLDGGHIVVAAGCQGTTADGAVTTLGRGGSDITAAALAAALDALVCEIYTDVDGVYTADPKLVPGARRIERIRGEEMAALASRGAGVVHGRAAILGQVYDVPIQVRSSTPLHGAGAFSGTMIVNHTPDMENGRVIGCALTPELARLTIRGLPDASSTRTSLLRELAAAEGKVEDLTHIHAGRYADLSFTVEATAVTEMRSLVQRTLDRLGPAAEIRVEKELARVTAVGVGLGSHPEAAAVMLTALEAAGILVCGLNSSESALGCLVPAPMGPRALQVVHDAFDLGARAGRNGEARPSLVEVKASRAVRA